MNNIKWRTGNPGGFSHLVGRNKEPEGYYYYPVTYNPAGMNLEWSDCNYGVFSIPEEWAMLDDYIDCVQQRIEKLEKALMAASNTLWLIHTRTDATDALDEPWTALSDANGMAISADTAIKEALASHEKDGG